MKKNLNYNADFISYQELRKLGFAKLGKNILISKNTTIIGTNNIFLGDNVRIDPYCFFLSPRGYIKIEKFTHIGSHVFISGHNGFKLGRFSGLASGTKIFTSSEDYTGGGLCNLNLSQKKINFQKYQKINEKKVVIGNHINIGANSIILPGTEIKNNASVAANSLINGRIKGGFMYAGKPLKPIFKKLNKNIYFEKKLKNKI